MTLTQARNKQSNQTHFEFVVPACMSREIRVADKTLQMESLGSPIDVYLLTLMIVISGMSVVVSSCLGYVYSQAPLAALITISVYSFIAIIKHLQ